LNKKLNATKANDKTFTKGDLLHIYGPKRRARSELLTYIGFALKTVLNAMLNLFACKVFSMRDGQVFCF